MWQGHLICPASSHPFPHDQPPPRRVYTSTPTGFERVLRACVGLSPAVGAIILDLSF
jgi:hypothetical protein